MRFQVIFTYDSEYKGYVADVPELPGCMSQGKTLDEAIENIKDAIKGYLYVHCFYPSSSGAGARIAARIDSKGWADSR